MEVSITQFRRDLFALVNRALEGEEVWLRTWWTASASLPTGPPAAA